MPLSQLQLTDILQFLQGNDKIDLSKFNDVSQIIEEMTKQKVIDNHPYSIWETEQKTWKTYLYDEKRPKNRRLIESKTKENLENKIYENYLKESKKGILFKNLYKEWITEYKVNHVAPSTINRIHNDYIRFYESNPIANMYITDLDKLYLDKFIHNTIREYELDKKATYNMKLIVNQVLDYAVDAQLIPENPFSKVRISKNIIKSKAKKTGATEVFNIEEKKLLEEYIIRDSPNYKNTYPLAILLSFQLGCRVGELCGLKWIDIEDNYIHVRRMERIYMKYDKDMNPKGTIHEVVEHAKTKAGYRKILLTPKALNILERIKVFNQDNNVQSEFIFNNNKGERMIKENFNTCLYNYCDRINANRKSSHKIRKTVISALIDSGMNKDKIREVAGHEEFTTTLNSYCYDRFDDEHNLNLMVGCL